MKNFALKLIRLYQALPLPSLHLSCRFTPTCSEYNYQAIAKYGLSKGIFLGLKRILHCHPLTNQNYDPNLK